MVWNCARRWRIWRIRVPIQDVRIVMTAILIQKETGGNLAEVLDKCANDSGTIPAEAGNPD